MLVISILILLSGCIQSDMTAEQIVAKMKAKYDEIKSYQTTMVLTSGGISLLPATRLVVTQKYRKPNKVVFKYVEPSEMQKDIIIIDGNKFWEYTSRMNTVMTAQLSENENIKFPWDYGSFVGQAVESFDYTVLGIDFVGLRQCYNLELTPKKEEFRKFKQKICIDKEWWVPLKIENERYSITYQDTSFNIDISDSEFKFTPPEDADIVEIANLSRTMFAPREWDETEIEIEDRNKLEEYAGFNVIYPTHSRLPLERVRLDTFYTPADITLDYYFFELSEQKMGVHNGTKFIKNLLEEFTTKKMRCFDSNDPTGFSTNCPPVEKVYIDGDLGLLYSTDWYTYQLIWYSTKYGIFFELYSGSRAPKQLSKEELTSIANSTTCGDNSIDSDETKNNCCIDVGCEGDEYCKVFFKRGEPGIGQCIKPYCGNKIIESYETSNNCCKDVGCEAGLRCSYGKCISDACGNQTLDAGETSENCCIDASCPTKYSCINNACLLIESQKFCDQRIYECQNPLEEFSKYNFRVIFPTYNSIDLKLEIINVYNFDSNGVNYTTHLGYRFYPDNSLSASLPIDFSEYFYDVDYCLPGNRKAKTVTLNDYNATLTEDSDVYNLCWKNAKSKITIVASTSNKLSVDKFIEIAESIPV